jgi:hypothetical protein
VTLKNAVAVAVLGFCCCRVSGPLAALQSAPATDAGQIRILRFEATTLKNTVRTLEKELRRLEIQLEDVVQLKEEINQRQFELGTSPESWPDILRSLQSQKIELSINLAGLEARDEALQRLGQESRAADNPVLADLADALQERVAIAESGVEQIWQLHQKGSASDTDVRESRNRLLDARIKLLEFRATHQTPASLHEESRALALERAELGARLARVEEYLQQLAAERSSFTELERAGFEETRLRRARTSLEEQLSDSLDRLTEVNAALERVGATEDPDDQ